MKIRPRSHLTTKARSKFSEARAAKAYGGKVQPASGAINRFDLKADVKSDKFLVDDKTTSAESYRLEVKLWRKLSKEAWMNKRRPSIRIEFDAGLCLYVVDEMTFLNLINGNL